MRPFFKSKLGRDEPHSVPVKSGIIALVAGVVGLALGLGVGVARESYPPLEILISSNETILGNTLAYPEGPPKVTAAIVTLLPDEETGLHTHEVPLFGWILEGELTVDYGVHGKKLYSAGDALLEAMSVPHNGTNTGEGPVRVLAVFMGSESAPNTVMTD